ncbi:MAG: hypothetical protein KC636_21820 [Myxococcales bacterium]|nr:hypothetical protein [Myxococcales bacterium]
MKRETITGPHREDEALDDLRAKLEQLLARNRELEAEVEHMADVVARSAELVAALEESREREEDLRRTEEELRLSAAVDRVLQQARTVDELVAGVLDALLEHAPLYVGPRGLALLSDADGGGPEQLCERGEPSLTMRRRAELALRRVGQRGCLLDEQLALIPVRSRGGVFGALCVEVTRRHRWVERWGRLLATIGSLVGASVERLRDEARMRAINEELAIARDQTMRASRARDAFLANMSHELRTPLNVIIGYCELVREEALDASLDIITPDLDKVVGASTELLNLITGVLDLSQLEAGGFELRREAVRPGPLVRDVVDGLRPEFARRGNHAELELPDDIGELWVDPRRLAQALYHVLGNATKFTQNGTITVRARAEERGGAPRIVIEVRDTGIGMTADELARVFLPFEQADGSSTRSYDGTGIGLSMSQRLCEIMGGAIEVESEPDRGSTFRLVLPACVPALAALASSS